MNPYNILPGYTAEASLSSSEIVRVDGIYNLINWIRNSVKGLMFGEKVILAQPRCPPCELCDPNTRKQICYRWNPAAQECLDYYQDCEPGPPPCCSCQHYGCVQYGCTFYGPPGCRQC